MLYLKTSQMHELIPNKRNNSSSEVKQLRCFRCLKVLHSVKPFPFLQHNRIKFYFTFFSDKIFQTFHFILFMKTIKMDTHLKPSITEPFRRFLQKICQQKTRSLSLKPFLFDVDKVTGTLKKEFNFCTVQTK